MATLLGAQLSTFDLETVVPTAVQSQSTNDFRLTLTTALPVTTTDVTAATTIYFTPYIGNKIALYSGSAWVMLSSAEVSLAVGTITADKNYDIFAYSNSGTLTLEALAWTNDTTRATALVRQDGVWCKTGALTRRYVGTFRTTSTTTTEDSVTKRFLFNASNRVSRQLYKYNSTSHTYTTATWRAWNNDAANSRVEFVLGLKEECVSGRCFHRAKNSSADVDLNLGAAFNVTNTAHTHPYVMVTQVAGLSLVTAPLTVEQTSIVVGYNYYVAVQNSEATGTSTWEEMSVSGEVWA